jgi:fatty acid desaturase
MPRSASGRPVPLLDELRAEIRQRGLDRRRAAPVVRALALHTLLLVAATVGYVAIEAPWYRAICVLLIAVAHIGVGCHTHTAAHHAASERRWLNTALTRYGYPFFNGLAATWWAYKHHTLHHPAPNVVGVDHDIDLSPYFALTRDELARSRGLRRAFYRLQVLALPLALALNFVNFVGQGLRHAVVHRRERAARIDLLLIALHLAVFVALPAVWLGWGGALWLHALRCAGVGVAMFLVFAPGHFPAEAACVATRPAPADFARLQIAASANFRVGPVGRFVCGGLERQIEHHLFPSVSPSHYPALAPLVREACARHGLPYHETSWDRAVLRALAVFAVPKPVAPDLDAALAPQPQPASTPPRVAPAMTPSEA